MDIPKVPHDLLRPIQSTAPAGPWLFPTPDIWQDQVVVETQGGDQYTTRDIEQMLRDLHLQQQVSQYAAVLTKKYRNPCSEAGRHAPAVISLRAEGDEWGEAEGPGGGGGRQ